MSEQKKVLTDLNQIPQDMTDEEEAEFWATHEMTDEFLMQAVDDSDDDDDLPPKRT